MDYKSVIEEQITFLQSRIKTATNDEACKIAELILKLCKEFENWGKPSGYLAGSGRI